jgi:ABC-type glycerol-3-phosphate transport system permease component
MSSVREISKPILSSRAVRQTIGMIVGYSAVLLVGVALCLPFLWAVSTALKSASQVFTVPVRWIPRPVIWTNFREAWTAMPFTRFLGNTVFITFSAVVLTAISASLTAYGFARLEFWGRDFLFMVMLATLMVPGQVRLIPLYILFRNLGWLNSYKPILVPTFFGANAFYIFLLRQFFRTMPRDLSDAARIDGCNTLGIYWRIYLPLSKPAMATVMIFTFLEHWDDFFRPLIYINSREKYTLALGIAHFSSEFGTDYTLLMAISVVIMLPCLVLFFSAQKLFVEGIVMSGLKQ